MTAPTAIVLAGLHGLNGNPLDRQCPRLLIPLLNRSLVVHTLERLSAAGIRRVVLCVNSGIDELANAIEAASIPIEVVYSIDVVPRGSGGCVRDAAELCGARTLLIVECGVLPAPAVVRSALAEHRESEAGVTLLTEPARDYTVDGRLTGRPAGVLLLERRLAQLIPAGGYQDLKESLLPELISRHVGVRALERPMAVPRVLDPASYLAAQAVLFADPEERERLAETHLVAPGGAMVHPSARIEEGARLVGPVLVGGGAAVAGGAIVIGPSVLGPGARVEPQAVVRTSVLWSAAVVEAGGRLDQCIVTGGVRVRRGDWETGRLLA